jgi:membrane protein implicated in regulation of membrane protease activity
VTLNYLLFSPTTWLLLGVTLLLLELVDGSFIIFLPSGLGSWFNALLLKLQLEGMLFDRLVFDSWDDLLVCFALSTGAAIVALRVFVKQRKRGQPSESDDINTY